MLLICRDLQKSFGVEEIIKNVSFILESNEKAALIGVNGAGKTSVFKIITGEWVADGGEVSKAATTRIGYLPQHAKMNETATLYEALDSVFEPLKQLEQTIRSLEADMEGLNGDELEQAMERYARLTHSYEDQKGYEAQSRVRGVLTGLGFSREEWAKPLPALSGGQQTRAALGKLLLLEPELLLLDEPTNHLDIESVGWLEDYLTAYNGGLLIISHDRYFLDRVTTKTIEIENKTSAVYGGNYSFYAKQKVVDRENKLKQYLEQQKYIRREEGIIKTLRSYKTERAIIRAKSREKRLDMVERVEKPESLPEKIRLILTPKVSSGGDVLFVEDLAMAFGSNKLFENVGFEIKKGDKTALIGPNGIGKTTLFKIIVGEHIPVAGKIRYGVNVRVGYYDQASQRLSDEKTIFQELSDNYPRMTNTEIRNILAAFVFTGDDVFKPVSALSGGERGRVSLAKIMLGGANFLILDEPTNHLDMFSKEILEEALRVFPGTLLYISHDRYFINNTATRVMELSKTGVTPYIGNYADYIEKRRILSYAAGAQAETAAPEQSAQHGNAWKQQKRIDSSARKHTARIDRLEREIYSVETRIGECDALLSSDGIGSDAKQAAALFHERTQLEEKLLDLYETWNETFIG